MPQLIDDLRDMKLAIFDLDGVIYRGTNVIPGVTKTIELLKALSIRVVFNSNNSTLTRQAYVEKLQKFGITSNTEDIFTSAYLAAEEISKMNHQAKVFVIGEKGLKEELESKDLQVYDNENDLTAIDYVVVGLDRAFNYQKLATAQNYILLKHAVFYATNTDATLPSNDKELPGAGCMIAALQTCTSQKPVRIFGKPSPIGIKMMLEETKIKNNRAVIFGDRLDTDILAGNCANIRTVLVLTGVTNRKMVEELKIQASKSNEVDKNLLPDIIIENLNNIFS
ncbi:MAG: HAD-IIA family hydrolase [Candidatus Thorarchaeota archaeon]